MPANFPTIGKVIEILIEEVGESKAKKLIKRLHRETVPSGNASYDETINRLRNTTARLNKQN